MCSEVGGLGSGEGALKGLGSLWIGVAAGNVADSNVMCQLFCKTSRISTVTVR